MQRVYIPSARKAALSCLRNGTDQAYRALDVIEDRQNRAASDLFAAVLAGGACEIVSKSGFNMSIVTKSIRAENCVTISFFALLHGDWIAMRHADCFNIGKLLEELPKGVNIEIMEG